MGAVGNKPVRKKLTAVHPRPRDACTPATAAARCPTMAAKSARKNARAPLPADATPAAPAPAAEVTADAPPTGWIDSADPTKCAGGKAGLVTFWLYVGALWLPALVQTFCWGRFGPRIPPLP